MIEKMLDSGAKVKIARLMSFSRVPLSAALVAKKSGLSRSRADVCLKDLSSKGILKRKLVGRNCVYSMAETRLARMVADGFLEEKRLMDDLKRDAVKMTRHLNPISLALFGSSLRDPDSAKDVDFLLIARKEGIDSRVSGISAELTEKFGLVVSFLVMERKDFIEKAKRGEEFVIRVMASHELLYGKDLEELVWQGK